jgi:hypothetical protein
MKDGYLEPTDVGAFDGIPLKKPEGQNTILCPVCQGHGGWNLRLYKIAPHFQAHCVQCHGWGYVPEGLDATCVHEYKEVGFRDRAKWEKRFPQLKGKWDSGNCIHNNVCEKCGRLYIVDSSD